MASSASTGRRTDEKSAKGVKRKINGLDLSVRKLGVCQI